MNDQTRARLGIITTRYARRLRDTDESAAIWIADFERLCAGVLRTAMEEIGAELSRVGHACQMSSGKVDGMPSLDWVIEPCGAPKGRRMVRVFPRKDERKGWEVLAEIWLSGSPCELTRFTSPAELTAEVAENLLVDAVEQILAAAGSSALCRAGSMAAETAPSPAGFGEAAGPRGEHLG